MLGGHIPARFLFPLRLFPDWPSHPPLSSGLSICSSPRPLYIAHILSPPDAGPSISVPTTQPCALSNQHALLVPLAFAIVCHSIGAVINRNKANWKMDQAAIDKALVEAKALVASLESYKGTPAEHLSLLKSVDNVRATLEEPYDTATRWLENMSVSAAVNVLVRIGVYDHFPETGSVSAVELASKCNADVSVITRAMRLAISNGIFAETAQDEYTHSGPSMALGPAALGGFVGVCNDLMKAWICVPDYIKTHKPEELYDIKKSPFAFSTGHEGKTYYEVLDLNPQQRLLWNLTLQNMDKNFPILGMFPFKDLETLAKEQPDRPLIVDVGGGRGQALLTIREHCGDVFDGKMILQDLPVVIESLKPEELPGIEPMKHDIFTPQPVKGKTFPATRGPFLCARSHLDADKPLARCSRVFHAPPPPRLLRPCR